MHPYYTYTNRNKHIRLISINKQRRPSYQCTVDYNICKTSSITHDSAIAFDTVWSGRTENILYTEKLHLVINGLIHNIVQNQAKGRTETAI
jgi:hypothetical protein